MHQHRLHLHDLYTGKALAQGGQFQVVEAGGTAKLALTDFDGVTITNPGTISAGGIEFGTTIANETVDIYFMTDKGYCGVLKGIKAGSRRSLPVDTSRLEQTLIIPFDATDAATDYAAGSEISTGFILPDQVALLPSGAGADIVTVDATETLTVGTDSTSGTNDPDGLLVALDTATAGIVLGAVGFSVGSNTVFVDLTGGAAEFTYGALYCASGTRVAAGEGADVATDTGIALLVSHIANPTAVAANKEEVTLTPSSGADTMAGFVHLPLRLPRVVQ